MCNLNLKREFAAERTQQIGGQLRHAIGPAMPIFRSMKAVAQQGVTVLNLDAVIGIAQHEAFERHAQSTDIA